MSSLVALVSCVLVAICVSARPQAETESRFWAPSFDVPHLTNFGSPLLSGYPLLTHTPPFFQSPVATYPISPIGLTPVAPSPIYVPHPIVHRPLPVVPMPMHVGAAPYNPMIQAGPVNIGGLGFGGAGFANGCPPHCEAQASNCHPVCHRGFGSHACNTCMGPILMRACRACF